MPTRFDHDKCAYLSKDTTTCVKGFLSIVILLAHIRGQLPVMNDTIVGQVLTASGYLAVAVFFFISGYGLKSSYERKGMAYIQSFAKHRILPFYAKYVFVLAVYIGFYAFTGNTAMLEGTRILRSLTFGETIIQNG